MILHFDATLVHTPKIWNLKSTLVTVALMSGSGRVTVNLTGILLPRLKPIPFDEGCNSKLVIVECVPKPSTLPNHLTQIKRTRRAGSVRKNIKKPKIKNRKVSTLTKNNQNITLHAKFCQELATNN